jgi:NADPH-dependent ferric siderophore reductase
MPSIPAGLASRAERWFARPVTVTAADQLAPSLHRVVFTGPSLVDREWYPGTEVEFRVSGGDLRHYTPSDLDPADGALEVVFHTAAGGPGSAWAARLRPGGRTALFGPHGGARWRFDHPALVLGDASTLGLFTGLLRAAGPVLPRGAIEVPPGDAPAAERLVPGLTILAARSEPGAALASWLDDAPDPGPGERVYLAGHVQTLQALRTTLRDRGAARTAIRTRAFWATGRAGL